MIVVWVGRTAVVGCTCDVRCRRKDAGANVLATDNGSVIVFNVVCSGDVGKHVGTVLPAYCVSVVFSSTTNSNKEIDDPTHPKELLRNRHHSRCFFPLPILICWTALLDPKTTSQKSRASLNPAFKASATVTYRMAALRRCLM